MEKRKLGNTGLEVSLFGFGGFHLLEVTLDDAKELLNKYLDNGGNYIETAAAYGDGISEKKIGMSVSNRRDEYVLASKSPERKKEGFVAHVNRSLENLKTNYLDIIFLHGVATMEELETIFSEGGAYEGFKKLKAEGKVNHLGISMHGQPDVLIKACKEYPVEIIMATINYYDNLNFPKIENELIPMANKMGKGIVLMKPIADGYLFRSIENAFNYAFSRDVSVVVSGSNNMEMLVTDIKLANNYDMNEDEIKALEENIKNDAVELGDYVCRRCQKCNEVCPENIDLMEIFKLEGWYDRQMYSGKIEDPSLYALSERLKFWFGNKDMAISEYSNLDKKASACINCQKCNDVCPYGIDVMKKLKIADYKLSEKEII